MNNNYLSNNTIIWILFWIFIKQGIRVQQPPRVNVFAERPTPSLAFRRIYNRGEYKKNNLFYKETSVVFLLINKNIYYS